MPSNKWLENSRTKMEEVKSALGAPRKGERVLHSGRSQGKLSKLKPEKCRNSSMKGKEIVKVGEVF